MICGFDDRDFGMMEVTPFHPGQRAVWIGATSVAVVRSWCVSGMEMDIAVLTADGRQEALETSSSFVVFEGD